MNLENTTHKDVVLRLRRCGWQLLSAHSMIQSDRECVLAAVTNYGYALRGASDALKDDEEIVRVAVSQHGHALRWASERLRTDEAIVETALKLQSGALHHSPLRKNPQFLLRAITLNRCIANEEAGFLTEALRDNKEFMDALELILKYDGIK